MSRSSIVGGVLAALLLAACSPPSDDALSVSASGSPGGAPWIDAAGPMFIEECSLGCGSGQGGAPVACSVVGVSVNGDVAIRFSRFVDLASVNPASVRIESFATGELPPGSIFVAPDDPRELVFRPALSFEPDGTAVFGLEHGAAYQVFLPGTGSNDPPPYLRSQEGRHNQSRMDCTIVANQGVQDYSPGAPMVSLLVDRVDPTTGRILPDQDPALGDISVATDIEFVFDDVMDLSTVVIPSTGEAPFLRIWIDPVLTGGGPTELIPVAGVWTVAIQLDPPRTTATFDPEQLLPSSGTAPALRAIVIEVPPALRDLAGHPLANPSEAAYYTERVDYSEVLLPGPTGETFADGSNEDGARSSADWGNGRLSFGHGGGSGRLGALTVRAGETLELATAGESFPLPGSPHDVLTNFDDFQWVPNQPATWPTAPADAGGLEFSALTVEAGGLLRLSGDDAARLFSRGSLEVAGRIDVTGGAAPDHRSNTGGGATTSTGILSASGGAGGDGGPMAGRGGKGGDRFDHSDNLTLGCQSNTMTFVGGIFIPDTPANPGVDNDGAPGEGVGRSRAGEGRGGVHWPPDPPRRIQTTPSMCFGDLEVSPLFNPLTGQWECRVAMVGGAGSGGGYARSGSVGFAYSPYVGTSQPGLTPLAPAPTPGGSAAEVGLEPPGSFPAVLRDLDWHAGELRGGAGGGGGGFGLWSTRTNAFPTGPGSPCVGQSSNIIPYVDHSAAGGGGGGGALQLASGRTLCIAGQLDATGGDGGGALDPSTGIFECVDASIDPTEECGDFAAPGGGGSGGAIKLQGLELELAEMPARLSVLGGSGGLASSGSLGGDGGPGLVRLESVFTMLLPEELAPRIEPYYPGDLGFNQPYLSAAILSLGEWEASEQRPDCYSAGMSCWFQSELEPFELRFPHDDPMTWDPSARNWNMDVLYETPGGIELFPYRGIPNHPTFPLTGTDFEGLLGSAFNFDELPGEGALFTVRFQGARSVGALDDPCDVDLDPAGGDIAPGSLTPWVRDPSRFNDFQLKPNMIRFVVVFDRSLRNQGPVQANIRGVTNLRVRATPE